jgi:glycine cleavage system H protein
MNIPQDLLYSRSHEWVRKEGSGALIGITDYAQKELGDLVFINLPNADDQVNKGEAFADVESVKAVSDVISPVSGVISEVNEALLDQPEQMNRDPYGAWITRLKDVSGLEDLLSPDQYREFVEKES